MILAKHTVVSPFAEGLTKEDIKKIKGTVKVLETTHFAIYLFLGVLLTLICKGNFALFVLESFSRWVFQTLNQNQTIFDY